MILLLKAPLKRRTKTTLAIAQQNTKTIKIQIIEINPLPIFSLSRINRAKVDKAKANKIFTELFFSFCI